MITRIALVLLCLTAFGTAVAQEVRYIHTDALGSVAVVTDVSRNVIERREYEPYGLQLTPPVSGGPGYTGHVQDAATGLTYMQQRYYDPLLGRFLSIDPVQTNPNTGASFNRYWYASNNPYKFKDPDGREVVAFYSNDNGALFMMDGERGAWAFIEAESGGKPFGAPVPAGTYSILERAGRDSYYRLERRDGRFGDDATPEGRTNLRLHGPGRTIGCIAVCSTAEMGAIDRMLQKTSTGTAQVDDKSLLGRITGRRESLKSFGTLRALPSGMSLGFDSSSGEVSVRWAETGSRIPKQKVLCTVKDGACK